MDIDTWNSQRLDSRLSGHRLGHCYVSRHPLPTSMHLQIWLRIPVVLVATAYIKPTAKPTLMSETTMYLRAGNDFYRHFFPQRQSSGH
jgi:hypothetical protein